MPATSATAPGKIILIGEHAVVYQQPAIAIPVEAVRVKVFILAEPLSKPGQVRVESPSIELNSPLDQIGDDHPLGQTIKAVMNHFGITQLPPMHIKISSTIPLGAGMGSSAAVSVALIRGLSTFLGHPLQTSQVNFLAYQLEVQQHGTPSGIDNTVITYNQPVFFVRGNPIETLHLKEPLHLVIADSGVIASTREMVAFVRERYTSNPDIYTQIFSEIGAIARTARIKIENGPLSDLGELLTKNHGLLQKIGVSVQQLDKLVTSALQAGALGAKLSGSGGGGNIIALVNEADAQKVSHALMAAGAQRTWISQLNPNVLEGKSQW